MALKNISKNQKIKIFLIIAALSVFVLVADAISVPTNNSEEIIRYVFISVFSISVIFWVTSTVLRMRNLANLSDLEKIRINILTMNKLTAILKKYIFSGMDMKDVLSFVVLFWGMIEKLLFIIFLGGFGALLLGYGQSNLYDKIIMGLLSIVWLPLPRYRNIVFFIVKIIFTVLIFLAAIVSGV